MPPGLGSRAAAPACSGCSQPDREPPHQDPPLAPAGPDLEADQRATGLQSEHGEALGGGVAEIPHAFDSSLSAQQTAAEERLNGLLQEFALLEMLLDGELP